MRGVRLLFMLSWLSPAAAAQEQQSTLRTVEALVSGVSGQSVFLDKGRGAHIEPGDTVYLFPAGRPRVAAVVESVSRSNCRATVLEPDGIAMHDQAQVLVPEARFVATPPSPAPSTTPTGPPVGIGAQTPVRPEQEPAATAPTEQQGAAPEHPEWSHPPVEWDTEAPLLAPPGSTSPADREPRLSGRLFFGADYTWDNSGEERRYLLARTGVDARMENPFGLGGGVKLRGEVFQRTAEVGNGSDEDLTRLRIDRLSWFGGDTREHPQRIEVGRFLQNAFPEFGVLDGVEYQRRTTSGNRWGASFGLMPIPNGEFERSDDMQLAAFFRRDAPVDGAFDWGLGVQKTWQDGAPDRDLLVADTSWRPSDRAWLHGSAWVDYYTSDDLKSGAELTELRLGGNWRIGDRSGLQADLSRVLWPDIKRYEFPPLPPSGILDSEVKRLSVGGWHQLTDDLRLNARVQWWEDEDQDGSGGELRAAWRDLIWERGEINATLFTTSAAFTTGMGTRIGGTRSTRNGFLSATWEIANYQQKDFTGTQEELLQQSLRGAWDTSLGGDWNLSLAVDQRFGDQQDALTLGFFLQRRF